MAKTEGKGSVTASPPNFHGMTCSDCAARAGLRMRSGAVVDAEYGKCPHCGKPSYLVSEDAYRKGASQERPKMVY